MWPFKRKRTESTSEGTESSEGTVPWTDILDPRGDGTIRKGDPAWDAMMSGKPFMGNFDPRTGWDIKEID